MSEEGKTFDDFAPEFRLKVLALLYQKPEFLRLAAPTMKPEYFNNKIDETFARLFLDFFKKYPTAALTPVVVAEELRQLRMKKVFEKEEVPDYLNRFSELMQPILDAEYIEANMTKFLEARAMEQALQASLSLLKKGKFDEIAEVVAQARIKTSTTEEIKDSILTDEMEDFATYLEAPEAEKIWKGIRTGIDKLDEALFWGGVDVEEMFIDCGPPGRGKSISLLNKAIWANLQGNDVLYYTLEVGKKIYELRYNSCITGIPMVKLRHEAPLFRERLTKLRKAWPKMGRFILRDLPARSLKPSGIRRDLQRYKDLGIVIKKTVVDYADIMSSDKKFSAEDKRKEYGDIYEELRGVAKEFQTSMDSASQGNRGSLNKREIDIDSLSEDFSKAFTADYVSGLCQTKDELKVRTSTGRGTGIIRYFLAKNRNEGKAVSIPVMTDFTCARMSMYDWAEFDERV